MENENYKITEIFSSVQGEGSYAGCPVTFVRFANCNKFCSFCDTDFSHKNTMSDFEILMAVKKEGQRIVVFTGGEPLLQVDNELVWLLKKHNFYVHVETNGSIYCDPNLFDHVVMSPKQSREETNLPYCNDLKVLYPYQENIHPSDFADISSGKTFIQPIEETHEGKTVLNLKGAIAEVMENDYRLSVQLHKVIGVR